MRHLFMSFIVGLPIFAAEANGQDGFSDAIRVSAEVQEPSDTYNGDHLNSRFQMRPFQDTLVMLDGKSGKTWILAREPATGDVRWTRIPGLAPNADSAICSPFEMYLGESNTHLRQEKAAREMNRFERVHDVLQRINALTPEATRSSADQVPHRN